MSISYIQYRQKDRQMDRRALALIQNKIQIKGSLSGGNIENGVSSENSGDNKISNNNRETRSN